MTDAALPKKVKSYAEVPHGMSHVYEDDLETGGYRLTAGGEQLRRVQESLAAGSSDPMPKTRVMIGREDWLRTISVATARERKHLLAAVGRGIITVRG